MYKSIRDPVDHSRTTRQHAGESMKSDINLPGMALVGLGLVALAIGLHSLATGAGVVALTALGLAVALVGGGLGWFALAHRKVRRLEDHWYATHPDQLYQPPAS